MRIRPHGTPDETAPTLAALAQVLTIHDTSQLYPERPPSTLHRVYISATRRDEREETDR